MGQEITITTTVGSTDDVRIFDTNRSLTGMEIERFASVGDTERPPGNRPADVLAKRLFELGAASVTAYSNVVTVEAPAAAWGELEPKAIEAIENLFEFYGDDAGWSDEALRELGIDPYPRLFEANK